MVSPPPLARVPGTLVLLVTAGAFAPPASAQTPPQFLPPIVVPAEPEGASLLAGGDFNHDGKPDVLVRGLPQLGHGGVLTQYRGDGAGGFAYHDKMDYTGSDLRAFGDLTPDGRIDAVGVDTATDSLAVRLGSGEGLFGGSQLYPSLTFGPVVIADFNADGNGDVVLGVDGPPGLTGYAGTGLGQLAFAGHWSNGLGAPHRLKVGDVNGDGYLDVVSASGSQLGAWLLAPGGFTTLTPFVAVDPWHSAILEGVVDMDRDGTLDLVCALPPAGIPVIPYIGVYKGIGAGVFAPPKLVAVPEVPTWVTVADLNGDALYDVATGAGTFIRTRAGKGDGTFGEPFYDTPAGLAVWGVHVTDTDGDGYHDLVACGGATSSTISSLVNSIPNPTGVVLYGAGTPGCRGTHGLVLDHEPSISLTSLGYMATLAPPNSLGILLASDVQDVNGIDPLFLGFVMHVGILTTPNVIGVDLRSDSNGYAFGSIAIAGSHWLVGTTYYAQSIFAWLGDCQPSYSALSSSRGIAITFQH